MRSQDILVFCFVLGSCLVSSTLSETADKRARNFIGKRDPADDLKTADEKSLNQDDFVKRVQEFIDHNDFLDNDLNEDKRRPSFLGKREDDMEEEKRRPSFLGKRARNFIGKRSHRFIGKRGRLFLGKRGRLFLGKRDDDEDFDTLDAEKRRHFLGKREDFEDEDFGDMEDEMEKRRHFLGKRLSRNFIGK